MKEKGRIILDLCGGTGSWSNSYRNNGYDVRVVTLPETDVRDYDPPEKVYGILAAPPCTEFAISGARWWKSKPPHLLMEAIGTVIACLRIIKKCNPVFWCLENPVGRLTKWIGKYRMTFQPYEYGDPWTKRTCLWGEFNPPEKTPVEPVGQWTGRSDCPGIVDHFGEYISPNWIHRLPLSKDRATLRSMTPPGFARAFYETNK